MNAQALLQRGAESFGRGDYDGALACFGEVLRANPRDPYALGNRAAVLAQLGRHREALQSLIQLPPNAPGYIEAQCTCAYVLRQLGHPADAIIAADLVLAARPGEPAALNNRALALLDLGRADEAVECLRLLTVRTPHDAAAWHLLGHALASAGLCEQALGPLQRALALQADHVGALGTLGFALLQLGRQQAALAPIERLLQQQPGDAGAQLNLGVALLGLQRHAEAAAALRHAVALAPHSAGAHDNLGLALDKLGHYAEALQSFDRAVELDPRLLDAWVHRGITLENLDRHEQAVASAQRALDLDPRRCDAHNVQGHALQYLGRHAEALACFERSLALDPSQPQALLYRSIAYTELERADEALAELQRALALDPLHPAALAHHGVVLDRLNRRPEALAAFDAALQVDPQQAITRYNRSLVCLALGRLEEGFRDMESRWAAGHVRSQHPFPDLPLWLGETDLAGHTILLHAEQGFGDSIQFARYAPLAAARGARVVLHVPSPLQALMRSLGNGIVIAAPGEAMPAADCRCPLMSLPHAFGTSLDSIPAATPYLHAERAAVERWAGLLGEGARPRIGLVWAGRQYYPVNVRRDIKLQQLLPLLQLEARWISLQKEVPQADRELLEGLPQLQRLGEASSDFADTAALIENLDLVITVDSAVAHLAGALGKPVWILNRHAACWRWLEQRSDSPWYPTARLFRQPAIGRWDAVAEEVTEAAARYIAGHRVHSHAGSAAPAAQLHA